MNLTITRKIPTPWLPTQALGQHQWNRKHAVLKEILLISNSKNVTKCSKSTPLLADILGHGASCRILKEEWEVQGIVPTCPVTCWNVQRDQV